MSALPPLVFTQRIGRRDYLAFVFARWPQTFAAAARRNYLGWLTAPLSGLASLLALPFVAIRGMRGFPVEQQLRLDDNGVTMRVGEREAMRPWQAFSAARRMAGFVVLQSDRGDVLLVRKRLDEAQRALLDAWVAAVFAVSSPD